MLIERHALRRQLAAQPVELLDQHHIAPEARGGQGRTDATKTTPDDNDVVSKLHLYWSVRRELLALNSLGLVGGDRWRRQSRQQRLDREAQRQQVLVVPRQHGERHAERQAARDSPIGSVSAASKPLVR